MSKFDILCIGSVLWDIVGRTRHDMRIGSDQPGRITRLPGGVAMNIAMTLTRFDLTPALLTAIGRDAPGAELTQAARDMGMNCDFIHYPNDLPTDVYMAIEAPFGLVAALADAHTLEAAGDAILTPLTDERLGSAQAPFAGLMALDGNLTVDLLERIATAPAFAAADLRAAPASPGKARRLRVLHTHPRATLYVNREEAGLLTDADYPDAETAARGMIAAGFGRVLVTDGAAPAAECNGKDSFSCPAPKVPQNRVTGAGDTFMAAHIAAEHRGKNAREALEIAQKTAARYVSGEEHDFTFLL
ncbi:MAG: kinase [Rhodobacterales bacterium]|nr:MAG: kinase [Rhodobacterales bacterium]